MDPTLDDLSSLATGGDYAMDYGLDTAPTGAGADPYGTNLVPGGSAEEWSTGMLPGGPDGQLSPWSPGGGFDFTNLFRGIPGWMSGFGSRGPMANPGALAVGGDQSLKRTCARVLGRGGHHRRRARHPFYRRRRRK